MEKILSYNAMDKLMRKAGAIRVGDDAKEVLAEVLERKALEISAVAKRMAEHAGRRTITRRDIEMALNNL
ncbi:NFYB/HAP3 family transcription factor subunit [Candidatus Woesearchaeota archaeon]|nr:NFYB/HAP3 family transcription factor subunit [Candidatus Woesearchaeota archaeon]